ncbi:helix-turn-helix transcriptional regulator [Actinomadura meridiana]
MQGKIKPEFLSFGAEVRRLRKAAGLNQQQLADPINVTRSYITQIETGRTRCRRDLALRLDRALKSGTTLVESLGRATRINQVRQVSQALR